MIDRVTDETTPEELEQLARFVAMLGVLGDRDLLDVVAALRRLAEPENATKRHPSNRWTSDTAAPTVIVESERANTPGHPAPAA